MNTMQTEWVIGTYTGDRAKAVKAQADSGLGYFIRTESGKGTTYAVEAAFLRPLDGPLPDHLQKADPFTAKRLDGLYATRHGER